MREQITPPPICVNRKHRKACVFARLLGSIAILATTLTLSLTLIACGLFQSEEEELDAVITFNEWLYKPGDQPQLKYYIEKDAADDLQLDAVLTMYNGSELVGINSFSVNLKSAINIDYFTIDPDINKPVDRIELKDLYLDGDKYSVTKTFNVSEESSSE